MRRVSDRRSRQYWDPKTQLSDALKLGCLKTMLAQTAINVAGKRSLVDGEIVWDVIATFPPGVKWQDELPAPTFIGGPVVNVKDGAVRALAGALRQ